MTLRPSLYASLLIAGLCLPGVGLPARAQTAPASAAAAKAMPLGPPTVTGPSKIAIINIEQAILGTAEGKKLNQAMQDRFTPRGTELQNDQKDIAALQKQLSDGSSTLSQQAQQDLNQQIQTKQRDYQQGAQDLQSDLQDAQSQILSTVGGKMMPIIQKYAQEHGYTAVIDVSMNWPQGPVLYFNPGVAITSDIIKLYDQQYPGTATASAGH
jgi:outer membrane protein